VERLRIKAQDERERAEAALSFDALVDQRSKLEAIAEPERERCLVRKNVVHGNCLEAPADVVIALGAWSETEYQGKLIKTRKPGVRT
jgi:acyl-coenzyme A thioesterase PaaI-like protein